MSPSAPSSGSPPSSVSPVPVNPHEASSEKFQPFDDVLVLTVQFVLPCGRATTEPNDTSSIAPMLANAGAVLSTIVA